MLQLVTFERNYSSGHTIINTASVIDTKLYGKPNEFEKRINKLSSKIKEDIDNETNTLISSFKAILSLSGQENIIRDTKRKLKAYVESVEKEIIRDLAQPINTITDNEQNLIKTFNKLNVVTTKKLGNVQTLTGIDGKILSDGNVKIYNLTGDTTVFAKMITDYITVAKKKSVVSMQMLKRNKSSRIAPVPSIAYKTFQKASRGR